MDHQSMLDVADSLVPLLRERARPAELARRPDDEVIDAAAAAGLFDLMSPPAYGGAGLDLDTFFEVGVRLGEGDASHAWVICFYIEHVWMLCQFPETFQRALFGDRSHVLAPAMISPAGQAGPVEGGYRLSGRWPWGTGIVHGEWVIAGATVTEDDGIRPMFFALPRADTTAEDTWHMDGMCGTGSQDVIIDDVLVPAERSVDILAMMEATGPGATLHDGPLYRTPMAPILCFAASLPVLGQARFAVAEFRDQLESRYNQFTMEKKADDLSRQALLARAHLDVRSAELVMRSILAEVMEQRAEADENTRVGWTAGIAHAVGVCRRAVADLCDAGGASAHRLDNPLQRVRRDVNTMAGHIVFDRDAHLPPLGRALLGLPPKAIWR